MRVALNYHDRITITDEMNYHAEESHDRFAEAYAESLRRLVDGEELKIVDRLVLKTLRDKIELESNDPGNPVVVILDRNVEFAI